MSGVPVHGLSRTAEYRIWVGIVSRCENPTASGYRYYGGRGIRMCKRWRTSPEKFISDMGRRPSPAHSIDRINPHGNYTPSNCRWATSYEQARGRTNNVRLRVMGKSMVLRDGAAVLGISPCTLRARHKAAQKAETLTRPPLRPLSKETISAVAKWRGKPAEACLRYDISPTTYFRIRAIPGRPVGRPKKVAREFSRE